LKAFTTRLVLVLAAMAYAAPLTGAKTLSCTQPIPGVTWARWEDNQSTLNAWCSTVSAPVFQSQPVEPAEIARLRILSWNVHVGGGHVEELLPRLLNEPADGRTGLIVLLQETFRTGEAVPESYPPGLHVPSAIRPRRPTLDVVGIAQRFGLSVAYVPSMRNGSATSVDRREDRGNAVLSTEPLSDVKAIELPFGKQRRVAVAATVTPRRANAAPMRVIVTHFDTNDDRVAQSAALAARIDELDDMPIVVGGDLNSHRGMRDRAVTTLSSRIPLESCGTGRTSRWPFRLDVLAFFLGRVDHMFGTPGMAGVTRTCETLSQAFHSDHLPLVLTIEFSDVVEP
jgi:endonuclease/exonuclease/phosphatase family metal-dependent hydrolase